MIFLEIRVFKFGIGWNFGFFLLLFMIFLLWLLDFGYFAMVLDLGCLMWVSGFFKEMNEYEEDGEEEED